MPAYKRLPNGDMAYLNEDGSVKFTVPAAAMGASTGVSPDNLPGVKTLPMNEEPEEETVRSAFHEYAPGVWGNVKGETVRDEIPVNPDYYARMGREVPPGRMQVSPIPEDPEKVVHQGKWGGASLDELRAYKAKNPNASIDEAENALAMEHRREDYPRSEGEEREVMTREFNREMDAIRRQHAEQVAALKAKYKNMYAQRAARRSGLEQKKWNVGGE